jgi:molybdopterin/thiamine biosynthesis adenylyltransferase/rhodanese-related sulfurtransferase
MARRTASALNVANDSDVNSTLAGSRELRRYSRHLLIPEVGLVGQEKLRAARVLVIGAGGLGAPVLQYLAAAGVGTLGIIDDDRVDISNLQRQVIYGESDVGQFKAIAAGKRANAINAHVEVEAIPMRVDASNARAFVRGYDVVVDATDTFSTRYLINDACRLEGKPDVYASIFRFDGQVSVFAPSGPCYRCLFPEAPPAGSVPSCAEGGVLGVLAGMVGTWQANEVVKLVLNIGEPLVGRLALIDALSGRAREVAFASDPACPLHGEHPTITDVVQSDASDSIVRAPRGVPSLVATDLDAFLAARPRAFVLDVRERHERALGPAPQAVPIAASELESRMHELDTATEYVVACRVDAKSRWAAERLYEAGFRRLHHLEGGLLASAATRPDFEFF